MKQYKVQLARRATKDLRRIGKPYLIRLLQAIENLGGDPLPSGCKKLVGATNLYRIRVSDYRIVYTVEHDVLVVLVVRVGHRKDIYDDFWSEERRQRAYTRGPFPC